MHGHYLSFTDSKQNKTKQKKISRPYQRQTIKLQMWKHKNWGPQLIFLLFLASYFFQCVCMSCCLCTYKIMPLTLIDTLMKLPLSSLPFAIESKCPFMLMKQQLRKALYNCARWRVFSGQFSFQFYSSDFVVFETLFMFTRSPFQQYIPPAIHFIVWISNDSNCSGNVVKLIGEKNILDMLWHA